MARIWMIVLLSCLFFHASAGAEFRPKVVDLINETQQQSVEDDDLTLVWWMPKAFWKLSLEADGALTLKQLEETLDQIDPYIIIAVVDGKIGPLGGANFRSREDIQAEVKIIDNYGKAHGALSPDDVSSDIQNLVSVMKPIIANMIGQMGENMYFLLFSSKGSKGEPIVDARSEGTFGVSIGEKSFEWRLPLSSLLPPKVCPVDQQEVDGAWKYCPWHGTELAAAEIPTGGETGPMGEAVEDGYSNSKKELKKKKKKARSQGV